MLSVYTRHSRNCSRKDIHFRRCGCHKWIQGKLKGQSYVRMSARTRSWEIAEQKVRELERKAQAGEPLIEKVTVICAVEAYIADQAAQNLKKETIRKSKGLLKRQLLPWCDSKHLRFLTELTTVRMREFRNTWVLAPSVRRKHEHLVSFFIFCIANGWIENNPMRGLKVPKLPPIPLPDYFTPPEFERILNTVHKYRYVGKDYKYRQERLSALVLLMRWSGLAIQDAVTLERERLSPEGYIVLLRAKTEVPVFVPLPPVLASALRNLPSSNPRYFFWTGKGDPGSASRSYQRSLEKLFRLANITKADGTLKRCHSHMFRHTFAIELLLSGAVTIEQISVLLGHRSTRITEKHYLPWVKARQEQLVRKVQHSWPPEMFTTGEGVLSQESSNVLADQGS